MDVPEEDKISDIPFVPYPGQQFFFPTKSQSMSNLSNSFVTSKVAQGRGSSNHTVRILQEKNLIILAELFL